MHSVRVDESNLEPEQAALRLLVDQLGTLGGQVAQGHAHVVHLVRDVVHSRPALGEELPNWSFIAERGEQLDAARADAKRRRLDTLVGNRLPVLDLGAEQPLVGRDRLIEVGDGDAEVVNTARLHAA